VSVPPMFPPMLLAEIEKLLLLGSMMIHIPEVSKGSQNCGKSVYCEVESQR
jgi:hypothetical protein